MSKKILQIWFDNKGKMLERATEWNTSNCFSEPGEPFNDLLTFQDFYEYKSPRVLFKSKATNKTYCMFLDAFKDIIKLKKFNNNQVSGTFTFTKKGQAQGIKLQLTMEERDLLKNNDSLNF
jgi:hypothetical protein